MPTVQGLIRRLRGDRVEEIGRDLAEVREVVLALNHHVANEILPLVKAINARSETHYEMDAEMNHEIRSGAEQALPLFVGYTERLRLDTDAAIGAVQVIERQLALLDDLAASGDESGS